MGFYGSVKSRAVDDIRSFFGQQSSSHETIQSHHYSCLRRIGVALNAQMDTITVHCSMIRTEHNADSSSVVAAQQDVSWLVTSRP